MEFNFNIEDALRQSKLGDGIYLIDGRKSQQYSQKTYNDLYNLLDKIGENSAIVNIILI